MVTDSVTVIQDPSLGRSIGLLRAIGIGVGAIVGGGILALAGVAFNATGPSAIVAFGFNGLIAGLTVLTFAELASAFPESGGSYTFAKKVLSAEAAFIVGWVVWLASILASALYALAFASYANLALNHLVTLSGTSWPAWADGRAALLLLAVLAIGFYTASLFRKAAGGGQVATIGKVVVFLILIAAGFWALTRESPGEIQAQLTPFFPGGTAGLIQAMGYTFIALQGFDLIAAVGGEVRDPRRTIPKAMMMSLAIAVAIYIPFLFVIATVGTTPGTSITAMSATDPAVVVAVAVQNYLGPFGLWLVIVAAILSMLSALHANLFAGSRIALTMARDRNLPGSFSGIHSTRGTPANALFATALAVTVLVLMLPNVAAAGAASSLIFLVSFALAHGLDILTQRRGGVSDVSFRVPWFPLVPVVGGLACLSLALYQGIAVPSAGLIALLWLGIGLTLYFLIFERRSEIVDAYAEGFDPDLIRLRGRAPLVLVPIAKPASAPALAEVANALAPPRFGRVLLLSVIQPPGLWERGDLAQQLTDVESILNQTMTFSLTAGATPECLTTVARDPWKEIGRVARTHRCESLLLGLGSLSDETTNQRIEDLIGGLHSDIVILRAPLGWTLAEVRQVLVAAGGRGDQSVPRARFLATLCREGQRAVSYLQVVPTRATRAELVVARKRLERLAQDEVSGGAEVEIVRGDVFDELVRAAAEADLVVLGLPRRSRTRKLFGEMTVRLAGETSGPLLLISRR